MAYPGICLSCISLTFLLFFHLSVFIKITIISVGDKRPYSVSKVVSKCLSSHPLPTSMTTDEKKLDHEDYHGPSREKERFRLTLIRVNKKTQHVKRRLFLLLFLLLDSSMPCQ